MPEGPAEKPENESSVTDDGFEAIFFRMAALSKNHMATEKSSLETEPKKRTVRQK